MRSAVKWLLQGLAVLALAILLWGATLGVSVALPYGAAIWSSEWLKHVKPSRETADCRLWYCTSRPIEMKDSWWGRNYELQDGEQCIQYRVFGLSEWPIDVVYGPDGHVRRVFESYE